MPAFLIPILISAGLGLMGGVAKGIGANQQDWADAQRRKQINDYIGKIEGTDAVTSAANQAMRSIGAGAAQRGMHGSGQHAVSVGRAVGDIAAQREAQEQALIAQLMQDPSFGNPDDNDFTNILLGGFGGLVGGAASGAGSVLGTEAGMGAALSWAEGLGGSQAPMSLTPANMATSAYTTSMDSLRGMGRDAGASGPSMMQEPTSLDSRGTAPLWDAYGVSSPIQKGSNNATPDPQDWNRFVQLMASRSFGKA